jgi:hypothetical protein
MGASRLTGLGPSVDNSDGLDDILEMSEHFLPYEQPLTGVLVDDFDVAVRVRSIATWAGEVVIRRSWWCPSVGLQWVD